MQIGRLQEVDVRELWKHEQYDFSNWLAKEENIVLLDDILGLTLTNINKEVFVGSYRCDLVAEDEISNVKVIIENQLEASNHDHLGKIITYASGLDASIIVWIVKEAREEHKSAIEWLNNNTTANIGFFLLEIHAYKIGDSLAAPKFEVIEMPNNFVKNSKSSSGSSELNEIQSMRLEFWTKLNDELVRRGKPLNPRKASKTNWHILSVGTSIAELIFYIEKNLKYIHVSISIKDNKKLFDELYEIRHQIEEELGFGLLWQRFESGKATYINYEISLKDFNDKSTHDAIIKEMVDKAIVMKNIFVKYLK